eukprot:3899673-Amphidinium_carterae.1
MDLVNCQACGLLCCRVQNYGFFRGFNGTTLRLSGTASGGWRFHILKSGRPPMMLAVLRYGAPIFDSWWNNGEILSMSFADPENIASTRKRTTWIQAHVRCTC